MALESLRPLARYPTRRSAEPPDLCGFPKPGSETLIDEIARVAVKDRRMLRELGFLSIKRSLAEEVDEEEGDEAAAEGESALPANAS